MADDFGGVTLSDIQVTSRSCDRIGEIENHDDGGEYILENVY